MLIQLPYNRSYAVEYARRWALARNPLFIDFTGRGGNCTNFVSQALLAGCSVMDFTPTFGWYYRSPEDRAPAWSGVNELYNFLLGAEDFANLPLVGPYAGVATSRSQVEVGDIIQLADVNGEFYHSLVISELQGNEILVCANSDNALDRPLSSYNYTSLRVLHILGAMLDLPSETVARDLFDGTSIRSVVTDAPTVDTVQI